MEIYRLSVFLKGALLEPVREKMSFSLLYVFPQRIL